MHQAQSVLGAQPTQEQGSPVLLAVVVEPHLLPVALILPTDLNALADRPIKIRQQALKGLGGERFGVLLQGEQLPLHHQIRVATNG
mgnify:CR=1 FL=1